MRPLSLFVEVRKKVQATVNKNSADVGSMNDLIGR